MKLKFTGRDTGSSRSTEDGGTECVETDSSSRLLGKLVKVKWYSSWQVAWIPKTFHWTRCWIFVAQESTQDLPHHDDKPRDVVVKMTSYKDRERILREVKQQELKEDFSEWMLKIHKELNTQVIDLNCKGTTAYLSFDRIRFQKKHNSSDGWPNNDTQPKTQTFQSGRPPPPPINPLLETTIAWTIMSGPYRVATWLNTPTFP